MFSPQTILDFWFREIDPKQWWVKDDAFDRLLRDRFGALHAQANRCELFSWRATAQGRLAEVIVLDQFSRNMFRGMPASFASDALALALAQEAVNVGADLALSGSERPFIYMPYMHSESLAIHDAALELFARCEREETCEFERRHRAIVERFARYPHRNAILGRVSTAEEIAFLAQPGSSF
jgi:uncharacterized protein (DUF924 family)